MYSIGQFAKKTGMTIRTLHYYDEIGLLKPAHIDAIGRRKYSDKELAAVVKISTLKYLGYPLDEMKKLLHADRGTLKESLQWQKKLLEKKQLELQQRIRSIEHTAALLDGNENVNDSILFSFVRNAQLENKQMEVLADKMPENLKPILHISDADKIEIEKIYVNKLLAMQELMKQSVAPNEPVAEQFIHEFITEISAYFPLNSVREQDDLEELNQAIDQEEALFPYPLSEQETKWFQEAAEYYWEAKR
ncbi:DNA-binding transcriptional MerR regulator [Bacillus ectoiniformans]|uniref:MerR family transcriptional regulator n=1 Tax=Bacillus ectoiniformans TaxID=1494429 RepID=UPI00195BE249|nr:MerR family transcriptional regulator [Bacillus ectoiniformans]MBM7647382.1 DNA-binding transcriptional MerR regulator [Bacillus ectoiniformans]